MVTPQSTVDSRYRVPWARRGSVLDHTDLAALTEVVQSGDPLSQGGWRTRFEERFRAHIGSRHAVSVTSGTVALELAIHLLDLEPGDEVVVTPQTYQGTIQPLLDYDVDVRFCDIDPVSLNLDPDALRPLLSRRTKAILLVHFGGYPARMDEIMALARPRGITVVEDCAHALGAAYHARRPGALGDLGCFSFHSSKNITTLGEGGMITCHREDWAERLERLRSNEIDGTFSSAPWPADPPVALPWMKYSADVYRHSCTGIRRAGTNATLSEAAAAVGLAQLDKLDALVERRRAIAARIDDVLGGYPFVRVPTTPGGVRHACHLYTFFVAEREIRDELIRVLDRRGVEIQLRYFPLHLTPEWRHRGHGDGECPVAERLWFEQHVNLPCHPELTDDQVRYLLDVLDDSLRELAGSVPRPSRRPRRIPCR
ncbi:DegT/DnrJ/EryC1/StrS family aminotransferase [Amycolatopsis sp. NPDC059027]|uniref:DegT/DnrJ/EryC1/StrS family aminotransferase n=1 Tax=unclassified Amycolatopsis TaxID=2618356 RepID=UPI0036719681